MRGAVAGGACLGLGVLSKSYPVILLPVVAALLWARSDYGAVVPLLTVPLVVLAGYTPFLAPVAATETTHHPGTGLGTFLTEWETNDFLFMLVYDNLRPAADESDARFILVIRRL